MIKFLKKIVLILLTANGFSQAPQLMSYQSVLRNNDGNLIINTTVGVKISILQGSSNGNPVYIETQNPTSNANGLVSLKIGNGTLVSGSISQIDWSNGEYYIKTETDPTGGTSYSISGTSQLLSVPYALYSNSSNNYTSSSSGVFSRPFDTASNIQLLPHGLGAIPSKVKITAKWLPQDAFSNIISSESLGIFENNNNTTSTLWSVNFLGSFINNNSTSNIVSIYNFDGNVVTEGQTATITVDSTNIILTWTFQGSVTSYSSPIQVLWEATK